MKITIDNKDILEIIQPNLTHKAQTYIFGGMGLFGTVAVILSREGLHNGIIFYLLLIFSIILFKFGGKPEVAHFNKMSNTLELTTYKGTFSKAETSVYKLNEIIGLEFDDSYISSTKAFTIKVLLIDGEKIAILPYVNHRKKVESIFESVKLFLNI